MRRLGSFAFFVRITLSLLLLAAVALQLYAADCCARDTGENQIREVKLADLPKEARDTLTLIKKGGPYPYQRDGVVFGNFERQLPIKRRGYYHEYTVPTPKSTAGHDALSRVATANITTATTITRLSAAFVNKNGRNFQQNYFRS
jgi:guanyl-specific ribonuclease Sa